MKTKLKITLSGTIAGYIWMPNTIGSTNFERIYTTYNLPYTEEWNGLRSAVLEITNSGDFRCAYITDLHIVVEYVNTGVCKEKTIQKCKLLTDCWASKDLIEQSTFCNDETEM